MRLWILQAVVIAFLLAVGFTVANMPRIYTARPTAARMCEQPRNDIDRETCAEISAGPAAR